MRKRAEFGTTAGRSSGVEDEGLDDAKHVFDELIETGAVDARLVPVDGEAFEDGTTEGERGVGGDACREGAGAAGREQQAEVAVAREAFEGVGDAFHHGIGRIGDLAEVGGENVEELSGFGQGGGGEKGTGVGEVPVDSLAGNTEVASDLGHGELPAGALYGSAGGRKDARDGLALEAFAESYHFPFVHGESVIGQNTVANTSTHDTFGRHHRMGFLFSWISNLDTDPGGTWDPLMNMGVIYWIYPNLILANSPVGVEILDMLPAGAPTRCTVRHSWMAKIPATSDEQRSVYDEIYSQVHAAVRDEDFAMLPQCGEGVRHGQHDHMLIGRNEIGVQHMIKTFAAELGVALD